MLNGAIPTFDLAEGGLLLASVRGLSDIALFSIFGTLAYLCVVAPRAFAKAPPEALAQTDRHLWRLTQGSVAVALAATLAWLVLETSVLAEAADLAETMAALPKVLRGTSFGHTIVLQLPALLAAGLVFGRGQGHRRRQAATFCAGLAILFQARHTHAFSIAGGDALLVLSVTAHLLGGGAWLGGLLPLLLTIRSMPAAVGAAACRWFSPLGKVYLGAVALTAALQGYVMAGGFVGLIGTAYGWIALVKLLLLIVLTLFAVVNRYRFGPALRGADPVRAKRVILHSVAWQTGAGVLVILAAGLLSSLPPGMHVEPVWPFPLQPSLVTLEEDPGLRGEAIGAVLALGIALLVLALGIAYRRVRWPAVAVALLIAGFALPHLDLFFVEAYPTSFYHSPTGFTVTAIAQGAALYPEQCASCHGTEGRGDGPAAKGLPVPPADLTGGHLWGHSDGELFWWLSQGIDAPRGGLAMPGFAAELSDDQRWDLIDYLRGHNAGLAHDATGQWSPAIRAPDFTVTCTGRHHTTLNDLRGKVVRIVFADQAPPPTMSAQTGIDVVTIAIPSELARLTPAAGLCTASDPSIRIAYSVVSGLAPADLPGMQFLVDTNGWLRAMRPLAGAGQSAADPEALLAEIDQICHHPLDDPGGASAHHHHP
jgi:putative copper export protein/mono/diheme cytochrome c family protein